MKFKEFKKLIKCKFKSNKDWEILLPNGITHDDLQPIIDTCREPGLCEWHIKFPETNDKKESVKMWWPKNKG